MDETHREVAANPVGFFAQLKGSPAGIWTTIGGGVFIIVISLFLSLVMLFAFPQLRVFSSAANAAISAHDEAVGMLLLLLSSFGPPFVAVMWWRKAIEKKAVATLFTGTPRFRWGLAFASASAVAALGLAITLPFDTLIVSQIQARIARFSVQDWLLLTAAYSVGIGVQATCEEVLVRGWLLQHLNRLLPSVILSILTTSAVFSIMHFSHPGWATYVVTFAIGVAFGWSAWRLNGLEAAIGAHIANNLVGALLAGQMLSGNPPTMSAADAALYCVYILGFLLFVEGWARFGEKPSRV